MNDIYFFKHRLHLYSNSVRKDVKQEVKQEQKICFTNITEYVFIPNNDYLQSNDLKNKIWWTSAEEKQMKKNYQLGRWQ